MKLTIKIKIRKIVINKGLVLKPRLRVIVLRLGLIVSTSKSVKLRNSLLTVSPSMIAVMIRQRLKR